MPNLYSLTSNHRPTVDDVIARHGLAEWWLTAFHGGERERIRAIYLGSPAPPARDATITDQARETELFLLNLATLFKLWVDADIVERILRKSNEYMRREPETER